MNNREKIEAGARAICKLVGLDPDGCALADWNPGKEQNCLMKNWEMYRGQAGAVIDVVDAWGVNQYNHFPSDSEPTC